MHTLNRTQSAISEFIDTYLPKITKLSSIARYSALPTGKCLRGHLVIKTAEFFGASQKKSLALAAAIELIHSYSLVHDDLPALDNDKIRRGKLSCHKKFGEANAILAGNFLLTSAFNIIGEYLPWATGKVAELTNKMIEGQSCDLMLKYNENFEDIIEVYKMKTGSLFSLSALLGGSSANCDSKIIAKLEKYGYKIGIAFQMADDLSDNLELVKIIGKEQIMLTINKTIKEAKDIVGSIDKMFFCEFADHIMQLAEPSNYSYILK
ncbi:MAG: polyprenyl synthetase family protein [Rickettsiaceae bacterium H1]|nr:polyprenyl synthetase family protein [Rickettsiaceae bacterium H1]